MDARQYHAFLSYNSANFAEVEMIYDYLTGSGYGLFLDRKCIPYGALWQKEIQRALESSQMILVIIGPDGIGPWQEQENYAFELISVESIPSKRIVPVFLPNAGEPKDYPAFLRRYQRFCFKYSIKEELLFLNDLLPKDSLLGEYERPFLRGEQDTLLAKTIDFYENNAEAYFAKWRDEIPPAVHMFATEFGKRFTRGRILDAGCGPGHHAAFIADRGHTITGIDRAVRFIDIAKKNYSRSCRFLHGDMRNLERLFPRNSFDGIWACASCLHLTREAFIEQMFQFTAILRPKGILGLSFQVDMPSIVQADGRFFERYKEDDLNQIIQYHRYSTIATLIHETDQNTMDRKQLKRWFNYILIAPGEKEKLAVRSLHGIEGQSIGEIK